MALGDIFEVVLTAARQGSAIKNVFHYLANDANGNADDLLGVFVAVSIPLLVEVQHQFVIYEKVEVRNLFDDFDVADTEVTDIGFINDSEAMADFVAIGLTLLPTSKIVRPGGKRVGGLAESVSGNGRTVDAAFTSFLDDIVSFLSDVLLVSVPVVSSYTPLIVGRIFDELIGEDGGYRLPLTQAEAIAEGFSIVFEAVSKGIRSQKSRRLGIGE